MKKQKSKKEKTEKKFKWIIELLIILFSLFVLLFFFRGFTGNAVYSNFGYTLDNLVYQAQPVFQFLFGGDNYDGQLLFERFLFFLIILAIVFTSLKGAPLFNGQKNIVTILAVIISLISIRYINYEWLRTSIMSYSVLGIAIISFLPFIIYFFFLNGLAPNSAGARKIGWILFICIYIGLYVTSEDNFYGQVYIWTSFVALVFLLLDGTIHRYFAWQKIKASGRTSAEQAEIELRRRIHALSQDLAVGIVTPAYFDKKKKEYEESLRSLHRTFA